MMIICEELPTQLHGTAVAYEGHSLILIGEPGCGKSTVALQIMAFGGQLIADDRCDLADEGGQVIVSRPPNLPQMIEARGFGLIPVECAGPAKIVAVVYMSVTSTKRLPEAIQCRVGNYLLPLFHKTDSPAFPAALWHYLKAQSRNPGRT